MRNTKNFFKAIGFIAAYLLLFSTSAYAATAVKLKQPSIKTPKGVHVHKVTTPKHIPQVTMPKAASLNNAGDLGAGTDSMRNPNLLTPTTGPHHGGLQDALGNNAPGEEVRTNYFMKRYRMLKKTTVKPRPRTEAGNNFAAGNNGQTGEVNGAGSSQSDVSDTARNTKTANVGPKLGVHAHDPRESLPQDFNLGPDPGMNPDNFGPDMDRLRGTIVGNKGGGGDGLTMAPPYDACDTGDPADGFNLYVDSGNPRGTKYHGDGAHQAGEAEEKKGKGNGLIIIYWNRATENSIQHGNISETMGSNTSLAPGQYHGTGFMP